MDLFRFHSLYTKNSKISQDNIQFNFLSHCVYVMIYVRRVFIVKSIQFFLLHTSVRGFSSHWKYIYSRYDYYSIHFGLYIYHSTTTTTPTKTSKRIVPIYIFFSFIFITTKHFGNGNGLCVWLLWSLIVGLRFFFWILF